MANQSALTPRQRLLVAVRDLSRQTGFADGAAVQRRIGLSQSEFDDLFGASIQSGDIDSTGPVGSIKLSYSAMAEAERL